MGGWGVPIIVYQRMIGAGRICDSKVHELETDGGMYLVIHSCSDRIIIRQVTSRYCFPM